MTAKSTPPPAAPASSARVSGADQPAVPAWLKPKMSATSERVMAAAPGMSSRRRSVRNSWIVKTPPRATASAIGRLTSRDHRQPRYWVSAPPAIRPAAAPLPLIALNTLTARERSRSSGKVAESRARAAGVISAAHVPCRARAAMSTGALAAVPPSAEAAANPRTPPISVRRCPARSATRPPSRSRPPNVTRYAVSTHWRVSAVM